MIEFTAKFAEVNAARATNRIVIAPGPQTSSKTYTCLWCFSAWAATYSGATFGTAAISASQWQEVIVETLRSQWGPLGVEVRTTTYGFEMPSLTGGPPNRFIRLLIGKTDSLRRHMGLTLQGLFVDEFVDAATKEQIDFLIGRCRLPGAKVFMTCNPMDDAHWSKVYYIDRQSARRVALVPFDLWDNPKCDLDHIEDLLATYDQGSPEWNRFVLGQWTGLSNSIYAGAATSYVGRLPAGGPWRYDLAVDPNLTTGNTHALLVAHYPGMPDPVVVDEWYWDGARYGILSPDGQVLEMVSQFTERWGPEWLTLATAAVVDPAGVEWKIALDDYVHAYGLNLTVIRASKAGWVHTTNILSYWLNSKRILIGPRCVQLRRQLSAYRRKPGSRAQGKEMAEGICDGIDALRYYAWNMDLVRRGQYTQPRSLTRVSDGKHRVHRVYQEAGSHVLRDGFPTAL